MRIANHWSLLPICLCLLFCSACSMGAGSAARMESAAPGRQNSPAPQPPAAPQQTPAALLRLPEPSSLATGPGRQARLVEADLIRSGADFDTALGSQLVSPDGSELDFSPSAAASGLSGCAYCIYRFSISGYDRNAQVRADWLTLVDEARTHIGLANWSADRWDWYSGSAEHKLDLASIDPYISPTGELLLVVMCSGSAQQKLASVRIGSLLPQALIGADLVSGLAPLQSNLDASSSSDPDGSIVKYEWDLDGNGSFETVSGGDPLIELHLPDPTFLQIGLRVTDEDGLQDTAVSGLTACAEWIHSFGNAGDQIITAVAYDGRGGIYAAGSNEMDLLLLKCDLGGNLQWARSWDSGGQDGVGAMAVTSSGDILVSPISFVDAGSGSVQSTVMQLWSPDGELLSSRFFDLPTQVYGYSAVISNERAYLAGPIDGSDNLGLFSYLYDSATLEWAKAWTIDSDHLISVEDMAMQQGLFFGDFELCVAGEILETDGPSGSSAMLASFDRIGFSTELELNGVQTANLELSRAVSVVLRNGPTDSEKLVCGYYYDGSELSSFISSLSGASSIQSTWDWADGENLFLGILPAPGGAVAVSGVQRFGGVGLWTLFDSSGVNTLAQSLTDPSQSFNIASGARSVAGATALFGGNCSAAAGRAFESTSGSGTAPASISWNPVSMTEVSSVSVNLIDLPGTVNELNDLVTDSGGGGSFVGDALLISKPL
ncbi:hypothetical protein IT575_07710 [bacterium]|nr:hypothetical protein [bacterium]